MPRCAGTKADGSPCERIVGASQRYCYAHDTSRAGERSRNARRAGRGGSGAAEVRELKRQLEDLTRRVVEGTLESGRAAVAAQLINTRIRLLEYARRMKETEEMDERLAELESQLDAHNRARSRGV
jgi:hypothetical protein